MPRILKIGFSFNISSVKGNSSKGGQWKEGNPGNVAIEKATCSNPTAMDHPEVPLLSFYSPTTVKANGIEINLKLLV